VRVLVWAAALALVGGCPPIKPVETAATVKDTELPEDAAGLIAYADAEMNKQTPEAAVNALAALKKALVKDKGYEPLWRAARACAWLSDEYDDDARKKDYAEKGHQLAKQALTLDDKRVESHYYHGLTLGQYAYVKQTEARALVPQVLEAAKRAAAADEKFDSAGPLRLLGSLYAQAPEPPTSVGDHEEGVKVLSRAVQLAPSFPQNWLLLGDSQRINKNLDAAEEAYQHVLSATPSPLYARRLPRWQKQAQDGLRKVQNLRRQKSSGRESPF
jgi:tetratricopeptide (TPR) repeat protein